MDYVMVTEENMEEVARSMASSPYVDFDLETQGLDPYQHEILLYAFKGEGTPVYLLLPHRYPQRNNYGEGVLFYDSFFKDKVVIAHNAVFEYMFMNAGKRRMRKPLRTQANS